MSEIKYIISADCFYSAGNLYHGLKSIYPELALDRKRGKTKEDGKMKREMQKSIPLFPITHFNACKYGLFEIKQVSAFASDRGMDICIELDVDVPATLIFNRYLEFLECNYTIQSKDNILLGGSMNTDD